MAHNKDTKQWLTTEGRMNTDIVPYLKYIFYTPVNEQEGVSRLRRAIFSHSINTYSL